METRAVDVLLVKDAVRSGLARYCRAMDRRDVELAAALWHDDGVADYGDIFRGSGREFAVWVTETHAGFARHSHQIANVAIEVGLGGAVAVSEAYVTVTLWMAAGPDGAVTQVQSRGRYLDRWTLRDRWAVEARQYVDDLTAVTQLTGSEAAPLAGPGSRDPDDPSYRLFASLT
jgi:SnoaL-like domain